MTLCPDGCGRDVPHWTKQCFPVAPWDSPGLEPRPMINRCARHITKQYLPTGPVISKVLCAYRDDDPRYCPTCHATRGVCGCGTFGEPQQLTSVQIQARKRAQQRLRDAA